MGNQEKPRIALVIGSGGIKCAAAIGMWRVLQEENISVDSVVVCSGGCLYGTLIANNTDVIELGEQATRAQLPHIKRLLEAIQ